MLYRNKKTGTVIRSQCRISGANWEAVKAPAEKTATNAEQSAAPAEKTGTKTTPKTPAKGKK